LQGPPASKPEAPTEQRIDAAPFLPGAPSPGETLLYVICRHAFRRRSSPRSLLAPAEAVLCPSAVGRTPLALGPLAVRFLVLWVITDGQARRSPCHLPFRRQGRSIWRVLLCGRVGERSFSRQTSRLFRLSVAWPGLRDRFFSRGLLVQSHCDPADRRQEQALFRNGGEK